MQDKNKNVKDDVAVGPKEYEELLGNFDKIDSLTKRLVLALSSKTPEPEVRHSRLKNCIIKRPRSIFQKYSQIQPN